MIQINIKGENMNELSSLSTLGVVEGTGTCTGVNSLRLEIVFALRFGNLIASNPFSRGYLYFYEVSPMTT